MFDSGSRFCRFSCFCRFLPLFCQAERGALIEGGGTRDRRARSAERMAPSETGTVSSREPEATAQAPARRNGVPKNWRRSRQLLLLQARNAGRQSVRRHQARLPVRRSSGSVTVWPQPICSYHITDCSCLQTHTWPISSFCRFPGWRQLTFSDFRSLPGTSVPMPATGRPRTAALSAVRLSNLINYP